MKVGDHPIGVVIDFESPLVSNLTNCEKRRKPVKALRLMVSPHTSTGRPNIVDYKVFDSPVGVLNGQISV